MNHSDQILVAQLGARTHYAVPRILHQKGILQHLYTDICATQGWPKYLKLIPEQFQPKAVARLAGRIPQSLPNKLITAFSNFGLEYVRRLQKAKSDSEVIQTYLWGGETFCKLILDRGLNGTGVYTFNSAGLEILTAAKAKGIKAVLEQTIAPYQIQYELLQQEQQLHPDWEDPIEKTKYHQQYIDRENQEWEAADLILCGSEFVKESIQKCNKKVKQFAVVPYGVSNQFPLSQHESTRKGKLRVLTVGSVGLRKGFPYVLEAAKRLKEQAIFRAVGPIQVSFGARVSLEENLQLMGQIPRSQVQKHFEWADIFLLPSICEGSATVTYEALAYGLPVIATPNTGSIIRDDIDGYIVPIRDVDSIVEKIELLISQPQKLADMRQNAIERSVYGSIDSYAERLTKIFS